MKYLQFSNNDSIPMLGLGTWKSAKGEIYQTVRKAIEIGYRHFDCALIYGNEHEIGQAISDAINNKEVTRNELWITSKLWNNRHKKVDIQPTIEITLDSLKLEYLDLYLIHWPVALLNNVNYPKDGSEMVDLKHIPLVETWQGMIALKENNLTKHIGVSNFSIKKINELINETGVCPEALQLELHPFLQQNKIVDFANANNIILTGFCPLGSSDRPINRITAGEPKLFENKTIIDIAQEKGNTPAQIMLAWAINRGTSVIPKSVNPQRLKENIEAADIELTPLKMEKINKLDQHYRYIKGDFWCLEGSGYTLENLWDEV
ncbi:MULTISPECIES: aldo/keto reductase [unclassified Arcicella]|uniref:aldo/keto reductase n=1 Tax=unclassified Arcicella TaxID=2644986 RepID=UPI002856F9E2|nr:MULTISPECIES: aldo/keto reductase [unclassified Arcicella]MDR6563570.1 alcohol dehydrogenase (NADP+) [Arcicella sp. BE51]MDR6813318.1 alcohol dehydrogenase (NADP+) [Arcicella sp. BE140]MDR6824632.1 alcohol dehydrogenase (NADP+) [Arcicella sp. BE139]